jgi:glycosyltransferase involved in cell wall biosynthesis
MSFWTTVFSFRYSIIHAQWSICGIFSLMSKWIFKKPIVITYRGSDLNSKGLIKKISHFVSTKSNINLCVSEAQQEQLKPIKSFLCPNLIDTSRFKPASNESKKLLRDKYGYKVEEPLLLFVGQLIPLKRPMLFLEVIKLLSPAIKLLILGDGELKDQLVKKVHEYGLDERVEIKGQVPYHEIHEYFQIADVHVMASENEGRPNVIYQAMACGIPSLATSVGGIPEMIDHDQSGLLLEPKVKSYVDAIEYLLANPSVKERFGNCAIQKLLGFGNVRNAVVNQHLNQYQKALEN